LDPKRQFNHYVDIDVYRRSWLGVFNHSSRATCEETERNQSLRFDCRNHYATKTWICGCIFHAFLKGASWPAL